MGIQLEHFVILTEPGAPQAETLADLGIVQGTPNDHPGQGTANRPSAARETIGGRRLPCLLAALVLTGCVTLPGDGPYQATGVKIGEVTDTQAIIWTRLTRQPQRIGSEAPLPTFLYRTPDSDELVPAPTTRFRPADWVPLVEYPAGFSIDSIEGVVSGAPGQVRVIYSVAGANDWQSTGWKAVNAAHDFSRQFELTGLAPATRYAFRVDARSSLRHGLGSSLDGHFRTAPAPHQVARVVFAATTGTEYDDQDAPEGGFRIFQSIMDLDADFFVHTGDILYYDRWAKNVALARWGWARMFSLPTHLEFHRQVPSYFMKDDHDTWQDDTWPTQESRFMGDFTFRDGQALFIEQVPLGDRTYRTVRWGRDVQVWLVEGRDYRSPNTDPDGPEKSIWGAEQKDWFKDTVEGSDATFRILLSPTPLVGPDVAGKNDSHANDSFATEGAELREFLVAHDMIVICGDRHWQYASVHDETGLREYATGPASDSHAGGWTPGDVRPQHRYVNVVGGFLSVTAERRDGKPTLTLRHHSVDGEVLNEDILVAD